MRILLYNPDNGVTRNFMPHLWMFLLQTLTPAGHEVFLVDGNAKAMSNEELVNLVRRENIGLVGIGAMTRMIAKAYGVADAMRAAGIKVVMGGPHVTEVPDEALGHADAIALGEADETWPQIVEDAARGELKEVYAPVDSAGKERKPCLASYPTIPWESLDLKQFNVVPSVIRSMLSRVGPGWGTFRIIPIESGRGCPYGCEFCTVTGSFSFEPKHRRRDAKTEGARQERAGTDRGLFRRRQLRDQYQAHQVAPARHHRGWRAASLDRPDQCKPVAR